MPPRASSLTGRWTVERTGGFLPPLIGVVKKIDGDRGWTVVGPLRVPFDLAGLELRYRGVFKGFVDVLTPVGDDTCAGRALIGGRAFGTFTMTRIRPRSG